MTFSFHGSLRSIPTALREAAAIQGLSGWQIFQPAGSSGGNDRAGLELHDVHGRRMVLPHRQRSVSAEDSRRARTTFACRESDRTCSRRSSKGNVRAEIGGRRGDDGHDRRGRSGLLAADRRLEPAIQAWRIPPRRTFRIRGSCDVLADRSDYSKSVSKAFRRRQSRRELPVPTNHIATDRPPLCRSSHRASPWKLVQENRRQWTDRVAPPGHGDLGGDQIDQAVHLICRFTIHRTTVPWTDRQGLDHRFPRAVCFLRPGHGRGGRLARPGRCRWELSSDFRRRWSNRLQPVTQVLASFPAPMLFPLVVYPAVLFSRSVHDRVRRR